MKITILTIFPEMFTGFIETSIIKKAQMKDLVEIECVDIRSFTDDKHNRVDDFPFGGGEGLVMYYQPVVDALKSVLQDDSHVILLTPSAPTYHQARARELVEFEHLVLICGHYEGYDERILNHVDEVISIGDYILTGGELASMVVADSVIRLIPGVITEESHLNESFETGLLEYPQYTRPAEIDGYQVPEVLLSGHHENIRKYRIEESLRKTNTYRPDLFEDYHFSKEEKALLDKINEENTDQES